MTTVDDVEAMASRAAEAAGPLARLGRAFRAAVLRRIADDLEARREDIVRIAVAETALADARISGELTRTAYQARLFARVIEDGAYLEAAIDHAGDTPMGPGPDLRRMLVPLGPVAVFGASNFPLAFSVPGGDTVSALAAGCPVIVKAHGSHPELSSLTFEILERAATDVGAPPGTLGIVFGTAAGSALVSAPPIRAVAFTGSLSGGRALWQIANARVEPIPFYGEMSSINPVVLSPGAVAVRGAALADGLVTSVTGSGGQLCTKPGLVLVPRGPAGDRFTADVARRLSAVPPFTLLDARIAGAFRASVEEFEASPEYRLLVGGMSPTGRGLPVSPVLVEAVGTEFDVATVDECFGPATVVVRYDEAELDHLLERLGGSLTATVHAEPDEADFSRAVSERMLPRVGRLLFDGWPTGVLVSWAQTHGGPWPATSTQHTSVGTSAIRRFLRPVTWQSAPGHALPPELAEDYRGIPRRVDGRLVPAEIARHRHSTET